MEIKTDLWYQTHFSTVRPIYFELWLMKTELWDMKIINPNSPKFLILDITSRPERVPLQFYYYIQLLHLSYFNTNLMAQKLSKNPLPGKKVSPQAPA